MVQLGAKLPRAPWTMKNWPTSLAGCPGLNFASLYGPGKLYHVAVLPRGPLLPLVTTFSGSFDC